MRIKNEKFIFWVLFLICLGFSFVVVNKILLPISKDVSLIKQEYFNKVDMRNKLVSTREFVYSLIGMYNKAENIEEVDLALPNYPKIYEVIVLIKTMAKDSLVDVYNFTFSDYISDGVGVVNVNFEVEGKYEEVKNLINEIGTEIRLMDIGFVKMEKKGNLIKGQINLNTYFKN
ncbi:MAG: hypothetical protein PHO23_00690 [Candidatus Pacebacteria bacterium]|nr:hypothetical protein [Candidatus Paceibacterota bacterium]